MNLTSELAKIIVTVSFFVVSAMLLKLMAFISSSGLKYGKNKLSISSVIMVFWTFVEVIKISTNDTETYKFYLSITFFFVTLLCLFTIASLYELNKQKKMKLWVFLLLMILPLSVLLFSVVPEYTRFILVYKGGDLNPFIPSSYRYTHYYLYVIELPVYLTGVGIIRSYYTLELRAGEKFEKNFVLIGLLVVIGFFANSIVLRYDVGITTVIVPFIYCTAFLLMYVGDSYFLNTIVKNMLMTEITNSDNMFILVYNSKNKIVFANHNFVSNCTIAIMEDLIGLDIYDRDRLLYYMESDIYNSVFIEEENETYNIKDKIYKKNIRKIDNYKNGESVTIINLIDITFEIEYSHKLTDLTNIDPLTRVKNRFAFQNDFNLIDDDMVKNLTCVSIDLDNLKITNDVFGHNSGDDIIVKLAEFLKYIFPYDFVYRVGGDEFLILSIDKNIQISKLINKLFIEINEYNKGDGPNVNFSVGSAGYCELLNNKNDIVKYSDLAMYESKENGKFKVTYFSKELYDRQCKKELLQDDFVRGIKDNEIIIYVQPKINMKTNKIISGEALVRWQHKELGIVTPYRFLDIATTLKLISEIDFIVFEKSCKLIKELKENHNIDFSLSVNLALETLAKPSIIHDIESIINRFNISPQCITFEILEDKMIQNFNMHQFVISKLKEIGFLIAIDDFGSNFSNFDTIKNLLVDEIKIDKSLTDKITLDERFAVDINLICQMLRQYDRIITIEGVETKEQVDIIKNIDIDYIQGYYFSKPLPVDELLKILVDGKEIKY